MKVVSKEISIVFYGLLGKLESSLSWKVGCKRPICVFHRKNMFHQNISSRFPRRSRCPPQVQCPGGKITYTTNDLTLLSIAFVETTFEWLFVWIGLASFELFLWLCVICSFLNAMGLLWLPIISAGMITRIFISFFHGRPESSLTNIKRRYYLAGICHGRNRGGISDIILL